MAIYSKFLSIVNGIQRQIDLSTNTLAVQAIQINGVLLSSTTTGSSGSTLVGDDNSYTHFTPTAATVKGALSGIDSALGSITASSALDGTFRIKNTTDQTKQLAFDVSAIATATTRTITMPDSNVNLGLIATAIQAGGTVTFTANQPMGGFKLTGLGAGSVAGDSVRYEQAILTSGANAFAANQSFGGFEATNLADPTTNQSAVTLAYMNARLAGIKPKQAVRAATTAAGTLATSFANGSIIDGVTLATGNRILIKDQATASENGIYTVNATGAPTRATDFDSVSPIDEINGAWVAVQEGTANAGKIFVQFGTVVTVGTDAINFEYFNPIAGLIGGDMITFASSTFSVDLATVSGLESSNPGNAAGQLRIKLEATNPTLQITGANELAVKLATGGALSSGASGISVGVDNSTIEINTNALRVKAGGIGLSHLASNSVDENKIVSTTFSATGAITGGSGTKVAVAVDNSSIEISTNALRIKSTAYDGTTITGGSGTAASVQHSPMSKKTFVAGEAFAANTSFLVRLAVSGETAGSVYKASSDTTTSDLFYIIGIAMSPAGVIAGQNIDVTMLASHTLGSSDTAFNATDIGKPVFLTGTAGAFSLTAPTTALTAVVRLGIVETTTKIHVMPQTIAVN